MNQLTVRPQDKLVVVVLNASFSWGTITDKDLTKEMIKDTGATDGSLRARKTLFPKASGKRIDAVQSAVNGFYNGLHSDLTFTTGIKGHRAMPSAFYLRYMEAYGTAQAEGHAALVDLKHHYPSDIEQAKELLSTAFNADNYPPADEIDRYYKFDVRFLPMPAGNQIMNALGAAVASDVDSYVDGMLKAAADDAKKRLRDAVARMAETLSKGGKIYDSMPGNINELAKLLPEIAGITDDKELAMMIKEVKDTLGGYAGDDFRKSEATKTAVGAAAAEILKRMGG